MARQTTAKPLTEEQKRLTAGIVRLVNHFVRCNKPPQFSHADFRSEMFLAVVKGASRYDASKGSFDTWAHRFMERHAKHLRYEAFQKSTYRLNGQRFPRSVKVLFVNASLFNCIYVHRVCGVYYARIPERRFGEYHL